MPLNTRMFSVVIVCCLMVIVPMSTWLLAFRSHSCFCEETPTADPWHVFDAGSSDKFTIVMQTYKRTDILKRLIKHYTSVPKVDQILVVWNNIGEPLPEDIATSSSVPVKFLIQSVNNVRNRLQPFPDIKTSVVFLVDDDLLLSEEDLLFTFRTWKQFPQRIVGYVPRKHILEPDGTYTYEAPQHEKGVTNSYSLVMTGASFVHRNYLKMFNESVPHEIHEMIDRVQNCEDLCMNVMVGDYLAKVGLPQPSGLYIKPQSIQYLGYLAASGFRGLSLLPDHRQERFDCFKRLEEIYHRLPLPFSDVVLISLKETL